MEKLINQIRSICDKNGSCSKAEASGAALKAIVFSSLCRSGFIKQYPLISEFESRIDKTWFSGFLSHSANINIEKYLPNISDELNAYGVEYDITGSEDEIKITEISDGESIKLIIYVFRAENEDEPKISIEYTQVPLPYEMWFVKELSKDGADRLQKEFDKRVKAESSVKKNKKGPQKAPKAKKENKSEENWQQPSLFDF